MDFNQIWLVAMHIAATWQLAYYATCHCHDSYVFEVVKETHASKYLSVFEAIIQNNNFYLLRLFFLAGFQMRRVGIGGY